MLISSYALPIRFGQRLILDRINMLVNRFLTRLLGHSKLATHEALGRVGVVKKYKIIISTLE